MKKGFCVTLGIVLISLVFHSCQKEKSDQLNQPGKFEFSFSLNSSLKSATDSGYVQGITNVVYTIEDLQGNVIKNFEKIEIFSMNGSYISEPVSLLVGDYKLTRFFVLDANNKVVYASPIKGSVKAKTIENPLSILFSTSKDFVLTLAPEVLSTADCKPEDFGYVAFNFEISNTFDFLVGAFVYNDEKKNFELTDASIKIYVNSDLVYDDKLSINSTSTSTSTSVNYDTLGITNKISLSEKYNVYTIQITKPGYKTYEKEFAKEELRLFFRSEDKGPLVVVLEKVFDLNLGLLGYYPFNGNVNDESGNGNNGVRYGATLTSDRHSKANSAYYFDNNNNNYISLPASSFINLNEYTYSLWIKLLSFPPKTIDGYGILSIGSATSGFTQAVAINPTGGILCTSYNIGSNPECSWFKTLLIEKNQWIHIAYTRNFTELKIYLNGVLSQDVDTITYYPFTHNQFANYGSKGDGFGAIIGCRSNLAEDDYFLGSIDDLRIYNRVLSSDEILSLYNQ